MSVIEPEDFRLEKLQKLRELGIDPYGRKFPDTKQIGNILDRYEELEESTVRAAGRVTNLRAMGKASFIDIKDWTGSIQLFFQLNRLGEEIFEVHSQIEPGDIVGVEGELTKTRTGEVSIFVDKFEILSKALLNPPEKWHGLRDQEKRYRRRSVDLFTNDDVMERFLQRSELLHQMRTILREKGFVEVETPMMQSIPGGAAARPFVTHHEALDIDLYLRIAPELYLKRLLVGGMERVFEINRNFRNEGISTRHNPEFTMLELYQAYADYNEIMDLTEGLIVELTREVNDSLHVRYDEQEMDLTPPWPRKAFWELMEEHLELGPDDEDGIREKARELELEDADEEHPHYLAQGLFEKCIEDDIVGPLFVKDYPTAVCPLAKSSPDDPDVAERFELYLAGMECANAYSELNDPQEQEERFLHQVGDEDLRERIDQDFLRALAHGMPPAGGLGIGIDRLVMVLTDCQSIREVILFPLLRPQGQDEE